MPVLNWIGKDAVVRHDADVPFRLLEDVPELACGDADSGNLIVEGDNLLALKALLPHYGGQVKCIYIDPPYNTGNEGWVYNDNVNSPQMREWLGKVVGKEAEDLTRHDKWLCMMYPRLKLLKRFLREDGVILVSLDGNEHRFCELLMDEIFGANNRIETFVWKKSYGGGAKSKQVVNLHEYVCCFARNKDEVGEIVLPPNDDVLRYYRFEDAKVAERGPYRLQPLATNSMDERPNLRYPIPYDGEDIWPEKQWQWSRERALAALDDDELVIKKVRGKWSVNYKQYLRGRDGEVRGSKLYSIIEKIYTQQGTNELKGMFGDGKAFDFPKPSELVKLIVQAFTEKDSLILDSYAGSGTTGHAVLKANSEDGGCRRFVLVEMDKGIAHDVTTERVKRAACGYTDAKGKAVEGLGGGFHYATLGKPLFGADGHINPDVRFAELARFVWFMETGTPWTAVATGTSRRHPREGGDPATLTGAEATRTLDSRLRGNDEQKQRDLNEQKQRDLAEQKQDGRDACLSPLLGVHGRRAVYLLYNGILKDKSAGGGNVLNSRLLAELPVHDGPRVIYGTRCLIKPERLRALRIVFRQLPYELKVAR